MSFPQQQQHHEPPPAEVHALQQFVAGIKLLSELSDTLDTEDNLVLHAAVTALRPAEHLLVQLATAPSVAKLLVSPQTKLSCSACHRTGLETYYLKRSAGKYAVLCFENGFGCWEKSARTCCSYTDQHQAQCEELSEWEVVYGDTLSRRGVCSVHVGAVLNADVPVYKIYPLDLD